MTATGVVLYFAFGTILFFFWVYGIVSFAIDLRRQILPWVRARWREGDGDDGGEEAQLEQLSEFYGDSEKE